MALLREDQVSSLADQFKATGFQVGNYGGGSAETYHYNTMGTQQNTTINQQAQSSQNLVGKIAAVSRETFGIAETGFKAAEHFVADTPATLYHGVQPFLQGIANTATGNLGRDLGNIKKQTDVLDRAQASYTDAYKTGKMSKDNYSKAMKELAGQYQSLSTASQKVASQANKGDVVEGALNTAVDIATVGKLQVGGASPLLAARASLGDRVTEGVSTKLLTKGVGSDTSKTALQGLITKHADNLEQQITKLPVVRNLLLRNTQQLAKLGIKQMAGETASQFLVREVKNIAVGLLIKRPLFYQLNIDSAQNVYDDMMTGKYGSAAITAGLQATQLLEGPFSAVVRLTKSASGGLRDLFYGVDSVIDKLSGRIGTGQADQIARFVQSGEEVASKTGKTKLTAEKVYRLIQENNLRGADENADAAVEAILKNYQLAGRDLNKLGPKEIAQDYINWQEAADIAKALGTKGVKGMNAEDARNLVVVRWDSIAKRGAYNRAVQSIVDNGNVVNEEKLVAAVFDSEAPDAIGNAWRNNPILAAQVTNILRKFSETGDINDLKGILSIPTAFAIPKNIPARLSKQLTELGYGLAVPTGGARKSAYTAVDDTRRLLSATTDETGSELFDAATAPQPVLSHIAGYLNRAGLSPEANQQQAFKAVSSGVVKSLDNLRTATSLGIHDSGNQTTGGQVILSKLEHFVTNMEPSTFLRTITATFGKARPAVTDIRQLTTKEIKTALNEGNKGELITNAEAKQVRKAINQGYLNTPLELRGLGDKTIDYLYRYNPAHKYYSRAQSALRYSYNPFFQAQEAFETSAFSGASGGNKITSLVDHHMVWGKTKEQLDATVGVLEQSRVFGGVNKAEGLLSSSLGGEAAQDQVLGRLTANITRGQKRDLAGLAQDIAARQGMTVEELLQKHPEQIADALRVIVQYPREGVLASPLARTLNIAFFPMRYNAKVTIMTAKILAKQPPAMQFAITHSLLNLQNFLQSDEGIRWRAQNNDAIQVFNWLSPLNNIEGALNTLKFFEKTATGQKTDGIASLGQMGGLPLGVITQVMDGMGWISLNAPYVDPTTGNVIPDYIPDTTRARAATALVDLLGSVFTYPGRTLGLPGKTATLRDAVNGFTKTSSYDFIKKTYQNPDGTLNARGTQELSASQQALVRVLTGDTSPDALDALYMTPEGLPMLPPSVLPFHAPEAVPLMSKTEIANAKAAAKAAKAASSGGTKVKNVAKPLGQY